jgi:hypothetical protein
MGKVLFSNYFPYCPTELENAGIIGSLNAIMALYWRVRTIQFTCKLGTAGTQVLTYRSKAKEEKYLVCDSIPFLQENPNQYGVDCDEIIYYFYLPGTLAYISIFLESSGTEIFIGQNLEFQNTFPFSIGATGLNAKIKWDGVVNPLNPQNNSYLTSVQCTEFWSYGGTYNTSTGQPL